LCFWHPQSSVLCIGEDSFIFQVRLARVLTRM